MKFSTSFKNNVCHAILLGFISQLCGTFALAAHQPNRQNWNQHLLQIIKNPKKIFLNHCFMGYVQQTDSLSIEDAPSQALMRCYQRMLNGDDTLVLEDVIEAIPELVNFALLNYEKDTARSG